MLNAYEARKLRKQNDAKRRQQERTFTAQQNRHLLMTAYEEAFFDLHGQKVKVTHEGGWYTIKGERMREGALRQATETLKASKHELELGNVD